MVFIGKGDISMHDCLCIITARGGSKRIPRKNVRPFAGKPLVAWPTEVACASAIFSQVLISTEDAEIANIATKAGALYPFARPHEVADDFSTTADVLRVTLRQWQKYAGSLPKYCCCLYGTSVFITKEYLQQAYTLVQDSDCVMAVSPYAHPIQRALSIDALGNTNYLQPEFALTRTQDCPKTYHDVGLFYFFSVEKFFEHGATSFAPLQKKAVIVSSTDVIDIDTEEDWHFAELIAGTKGLTA